MVEGSTVISDVVQIDMLNGSNGVCARVIDPFIPAAGSHTYKVQWKVSAGTGTIRTTSLCPAVFRIIKP